MFLRKGRLIQKMLSNEELMTLLRRQINAHGEKGCRDRLKPGRDPLFGHLSCIPFFRHCTAPSHGLHSAARNNTITKYVEIKCQLDATEVLFANLIACSTCFGHYYAHHQELEGYVSGLQDAAASCKPDT